MFPIVLLIVLGAALVFGDDDVKKPPAPPAKPELEQKPEEKKPEPAPEPKPEPAS